MRRFFDLDSGIMRFLSQVADLMMLNVLFIICCLPVVTIGASLTGLSYMTLKAARGEEGYMIKGFLKAFRANFKKATILWLIVLAVGAVLALDLSVTIGTGGSVMQIYRYAFYACVLMYIMIVLYVFPLQAQFENTIIGTLKNAFMFSIAYFPYTVIMTIVTVGAVLLTFFNAMTFTWGLLIWLMIGFALVARINAACLIKAFANYMPKEDETDPDHWEL